MNLPAARPGLWRLFVSFLGMGLQSFGGGSSTLIMISHANRREGWMSEEEFVRTWALVQIAPGINLVKLTALIGKRLRGWPGLVAAMAGLLIPSAAVTVLMTAGFTLIRGHPLVRAAMKGVLPATIGLALAMSYQMARPQLTRAQREGPARLAASLAILASASLLLGVAGATPVVVLLVSGLAAVLLLALVPARASTAPEESGE